MFHAITRLGLLCLTLSYLIILGLTTTIKVHAQDHVEVNKKSKIRYLISSEKLETMGHYGFQNLKKAEQNHLVSTNDPRFKTLRRILNRMLPFVAPYQSRAKLWQWQLALIDKKEVNAACFAGGKIFFYTGILEELSLTEAEQAAIMGHEIAHALWEHSREQLAKTFLVNKSAKALKKLTSSEFKKRSIKWGSHLLKLAFSRTDELEADVIGLELMAKAGYDPQAALRVWDKMRAWSQKQPHSKKYTTQQNPQEIPKKSKIGRFGSKFKNWAHKKKAKIKRYMNGFLRTHPRSEVRKEKLHAQINTVMKIYEHTKAK
jgi:predicted Zn-dependent protease